MLVQTSVSRDIPVRFFAQAALFWLVVAAFMGVYLRWQVWGKVPVEFSLRSLTHGHSHVMFLGWAFNALLAGLIRYFLPRVVSVIYYQIGVILQVAVAGMAVSFPLQGYKLVSIAFTTLHLFFAAVLIGRLWKDCRTKGPALAAFRWAVFFLFLSALGPFGLAFLAFQQMSDTIWYNLAVYFYLHFQYSGWMVFALLAILLGKMPLSGKSYTRAVHLLATGTLAGYALNTLWAGPSVAVNILAALGALMQLAAIFQLGQAWMQTYRLREVWKRTWSYRFAGIAVAAFGLKLLLQLGGAIPGVGDLLFEQRNWLIAYFHMVFIGVVSMLLLAVFLEKMWIPRDSSLGAAWWIFTIGFVLTEVLLILPVDNLLGLLVCAVGMALSLFWVARQTIYAPEVSAY